MSIYDQYISDDDKNKMKKIHLRSLFYPMYLKKRKLKKIKEKVVKILSEHGINYPISMDFDYSTESSIYSPAEVENNSYLSGTIKIHYNPKFIADDFNELVVTGLHEYSHIFCHQAIKLKNSEFSNLGLFVSNGIMLDSINLIINKEMTPQTRNLINQKKIPITDKLREDFFCEPFGYYLMNRGNFSDDEKVASNCIIKTHIKIMNSIYYKF